MRKLSILALTAIMAAGFTSMTSEAAERSRTELPVQGKNCFVIRRIEAGSIIELKDKLAELGVNLGGLNCPGINKPEVPDAEQPAPEVPDTEQPAPEVPDTEQPAPEIPDIEQPAPEAPDQNKPDQAPEEDVQLSFQQQVVWLVNKERTKAGLSPLTVNIHVEQAALVRAKEIVSSFSHTRPNGTSFTTALKESGASYRGAGENIAWGQKTPEQVMNGWMNSPGHKANILNEKFTAIGIGYYQSPEGVNYWTQLFTY